MSQRSDFHDASLSGLRVEPRHPPHRSAAGHIDGVEASSGGLLRATLGAAGAAGVILTVFWLPAEYGIDPTGLGRILGLTGMGEIKQQLYAEAAIDDAAIAGQTGPEQLPALAAAVGTDPALFERLDRIDAQLATIATLIGADGPGGPTAAVAPVSNPAPVAPAAMEWRDEWSYTLDPGQGVEVKLVMQEGTTAEFEWTANGGVLNHDTHGDGGGQEVTYERGRNVPSQQGTLTAAFTGNHGWFWRNRTETPVTFTIRTRGDYQRMLTP